MTWFSSLDVSREQLARAVTFGRGTVRVNADEHPELDSRATVEQLDGSTGGIPAP